MYADDLKIFMPVKSLVDAINLQSDLDRLSDWCVCNVCDVPKRQQM